jgi:hypothetical protein
MSATVHTPGIAIPMPTRCIRCHELASMARVRCDACGRKIKHYSRDYDAQWWLLVEAFERGKAPPKRCRELLLVMRPAHRDMLRTGLDPVSAPELEAVAVRSDTRSWSGFVEFDRVISESCALRIYAAYDPDGMGERTWLVELLGLVTPEGFVRAPVPVEVTLSDAEATWLDGVVKRGTR